MERVSGAGAESDLAQKQCRSCEGAVKPLPAEEIKTYLEQLENWELSEGKIVRRFKFKNYYETTAFTNAVAWIAHQQDHHPDICFGYKQCEVSYFTHAVNGLTENDFICAAKIDSLI